MKEATIRLPHSEIEEGSWLKIVEVLIRSDIEALSFYENSGPIDPPGHTGRRYRE